MRSPLFPVLITFLSSAFLLFSCRSELATDIMGRGEAMPRLVQSAKKWHAAHRDKNAQDTILPYWEHAWIMVTADGAQVLIAPGPGRPIVNKNHSFSRFFVFNTERGRISQGRIVEFMGNNYNVARSTDHLLENYNQPVIIGFNGSVLQYDMNHRQVEDATFQNGHKNDNISVRFVTMSVEDFKELMKPAKTEEELKARTKRLQEEKTNE